MRSLSNYSAESSTASVINQRFAQIIPSNAHTLCFRVSAAVEAIIQLQTSYLSQKRPRKDTLRGGRDASLWINFSKSAYLDVDARRYREQIAIKRRLPTRWLREMVSHCERSIEPHKHMQINFSESMDCKVACCCWLFSAGQRAKRRAAQVTL